MALFTSPRARVGANALPVGLAVRPRAGSEDVPGEVVTVAISAGLVQSRDQTFFRFDGNVGARYFLLSKTTNFRLPQLIDLRGT